MKNRHLRIYKKLTRQDQSKYIDLAVEQTLKALSLKDFSQYFADFEDGPRSPLAQQQPNGTWLHHIDDGLGSVRQVVDANNGVLETRNYTPFGETFDQFGTEQSIYGFTSEPHTEAGHVHLRARDYIPTMGVFPSPDPRISDSLRQILDLNSYNYVQSNPINLVDPTGLYGESPKNCNPWNNNLRENSFYCDGTDRSAVDIALLDLKRYGVHLEISSPASVCLSGENASDAECQEGCWTAGQANTVLQSIRKQASIIMRAGGNFTQYLAPPDDGTTVVMSSGMPTDEYGDPLGYVAWTPLPTDNDKRRIIIWDNGKTTWLNGGLIFSPELITHEFGHILSNEWFLIEKEISATNNNIEPHLLSFRLFNEYYNASFPRQLDVIRKEGGEIVLLWEPFEHGSSSQDNRSTGRFYDDRYTAEEFTAEAYAVWIYNKYKSGSEQPAKSDLTVDDLVNAQKTFWESVFRGNILPGTHLRSFTET